MYFTDGWRRQKSPFNVLYFVSGPKGGRRLSRCPCSGLGCGSFLPAHSGPPSQADAGTLVSPRSAPEGPCRLGGSGRRRQTSCCHWSAAGWACCLRSSAARPAPAPGPGTPACWTPNSSSLCIGETLRFGS